MARARRRAAPLDAVRLRRAPSARRGRRRADHAAVARRGSALRLAADPCRCCIRRRDAAWLDPAELRIGLGCMRLPAESAPETIAAAAEAGDDRLRHGARVRGQRGDGGARTPQLRRGRLRADRDEGRHVASRRRLGGGRPREGDPRRLRGEPRRARRAPDRPLPPARARPADAVADVRARTRTARGRRPRAANRARERQPHPARRGARARAGRGRPGGALAVRRPGSPRRASSSAARSSGSRCSRTRRSAGRSAPDASTRRRRSRGSSASRRSIVPIPGARRPGDRALGGAGRRRGTARRAPPAGAARQRRPGPTRRSCS